MNHHHIVQLIKSYDNQKSWSEFRVIPITKPISFEFYQSWIAQGYHGSMEYLKRHAPLKESPTHIFPQAKSILIFRFPYLEHPWPQSVDHKKTSPSLINLKNSALKIARYARGYDYHDRLIKELNELIAYLKKFFPQEHFLSVSDSSPLLERDYAYQAGLGWIGKNTCLIDPKEGSFFLLGEILSSLDLENTAPRSQSPPYDFCGKCQLCIEQCPTQALLPGKYMNAQRCLSYWNIESQDIPPVDIRNQMGSWFFGCDICQEVCPWNQKIFSNQKISTTSLENSRQSLIEELFFFLTASNREIQMMLKNTALLRARPFGLRRNAIIVATNLSLKELLDPILKCIQRYPRLSPLKQWVMEKLI